MRIIVTTALVALALVSVAEAKDMKACSADWKAAQAAHTKIKHNDFMASCLKGPVAVAPSPVAPPAKPAKPFLFGHHAVPTSPVAPVAPLATVKGPAPNGATAQCKDGSWSMAAHHSGACSHHGGVAKFLK